MSFRPIYEGWDIPGRLSRKVRSRFAGIGLNRDLKAAQEWAATVASRLSLRNLDTEAGQMALAHQIVCAAMERLAFDPADNRFTRHLTAILFDLITYEGWFALPPDQTLSDLARSELWALEDHLQRSAAIVDHIDDVAESAAEMMAALVRPLVEQQPQLMREAEPSEEAMAFASELSLLIGNPSELVEHMIGIAFAPELEPLKLTPRLRERLDYNLLIASGGVPGDPKSVRTPKLPTRQTTIADDKVANVYLEGTPFLDLFDYQLDIQLPRDRRFEHMHIVAGSGHGKTQTLQHLILHDLDAVARGEASVIVIDSQSDLINNIAGLGRFAPGSDLSGRLVLVDPTDIEWPVALNLFDAGLDRLEDYSPLDRERLTNSILELYDFVLGSLLDAGMTQKQNVIFRYITRLLLHIPNATIHTLRELLEEGGYERYQPHIQQLQGSARAFFENEFNGREFAATKRQVLRRLYGILENQTFERMFSHPKSKLDLFTEMNAGKVILINTAKDLLKENGTEIFGRFFIAMMAQAAQERAVLKPEDRLPTFVYIDEANDYFDRNIGIILSQARKYRVGVTLAHQYLGQLEPKLHEAIAANTAIKFAGGVSAKDARALANDLRTDASFIEGQPRLSFAAFIKGQYERSVSVAITPGQMEGQDRMSAHDAEAVRDAMRENYAVHYSELFADAQSSEENSEAGSNRSDDNPDTGEPMEW